MATASEPAQKIKPKATVFISYSRKDMAFADRLEGALKARGFDPLIDRTEIYAFEDWWKRIQSLIGKADTVIFVLSPDAVASEICVKEVVHAASLNKRFAPIVCRRADDSAVPEPLRRLNFIFFDDPASFDASVDRLVDALQVDIGWIRKHTEYGERARHWSAAGGPGGLLLRSPALEEAEHWIALRPSNAPAPTAETQVFVAESRRGATRRRNVLTGSLVAGLLIALVLAGMAYWQRGIAVEQKGIAQEQRKAAVQQRNIADQQRQEAEQQRQAAVANLNLAQLAQSKLLASLGIEDVRAGDAVTGLLLALQGQTNVPKTITAGDQALITASLIAALQNQRELLVLPQSGKVRSAEYSLSGSFVLTTVTDSNSAFLSVAAGGQPPIALAGSQSPITAAHFSSNGAMIFAFSEHEKKLFLYDGKDGQQIRSIDAPDLISGAAFSPDSRRIAIAAQSIAQVWDAGSGKLLSQVSIPDDMGVVLNVAFSPDGQRLALSGGSGTLLWDMVRGHKMTSLEGCKDATVAFSRDSQLIVTVPNCSGSKEAYLWDVKTGRKLFELDGHLGNLTGASFSADGRRIVTSARDATARIWDVKSGHTTAILAGHKGWVNSVAYDRAGAYILTASDDGTIRIWDGQSGVALAVLGGHLAEVETAVYSNDGSRIISASDDGTARIWASELPNAPVVFQSGRSDDASGATVDALVSGGAQRIATVNNKSGVSVWDTKTGKLIFALADQTVPAYSPDGTRLVTASTDNTARVWDAQTGRPIAILRGHNGRVARARFSSDGKRIVTAAADQSVKIWDSDTGKQLQSMAMPQPVLSDSKFSSDGNLVVTLAKHNPSEATTDNDGDTITVWNGAEGRVLATLHPTDGDPQNPSSVLDVAFNSAGTLVLAVYSDGRIRSWETVNGGQASSVSMSARFLENAAFSADSQEIIYADASDGSVHLTDASSGITLGDLSKQNEDVAAIEPSLDGTHVTIVSSDLQGKGSNAWQVVVGRLFPNSQLADAARTSAPRCLTREQMQKISEAVPPDWCIGMARWPYASQAWRDWLAQTKAGRNPGMPATQ